MVIYVEVNAKDEDYYETDPFAGARWGVSKTEKSE